MKYISRHVIDLERAQEGVENSEQMLVDLLKAANSRAAALSVLLSAAKSRVGYLAAVGKKRAELGRALRVGAQAAAAIFALGGGTGDIEFALGEQRVRLAATGPTDATHIGNWRVGWWLAHIVGDQAAIDVLVATPINVLRSSSTRGDACQYLFIEALQAFERRAPDWSTKLKAALDATDPEQIKMIDEEFVLNILVPEMQMLYYLAIGEIAGFDEAIVFALERHKKYWSKGNRKRDPEGYLALGPMAIATLAYDAGMPIEIESEYLQLDLIT